MSKEKCRVCGRSFTLVGKNTLVLANHGFTVDCYGQSTPCRGSGYKPENSLTGPIKQVECAIEYWNGQEDKYKGRADLLRKELAELVEKKDRQSQEALDEILPEFDKVKENSKDIYDQISKLDSLAVELNERLQGVNNKIKLLSVIGYANDYNEAHIINELLDKTNGEYLFIPEND